MFQKIFSPKNKLWLELRSEYLSETYAKLWQNMNTSLSIGLDANHICLSVVQMISSVAQEVLHIPKK